jgi:hypothetical protein
VTVTVDSEVESTFFRRSGRSAGVSVAVYLRTRGLSASARSPVPALFNDNIRVWMGVVYLEIRTRVQGCALDGAFRSGIR